MADKMKADKGTDPDVRPTTGQESNENWDDVGTQEPDTRGSESGLSARRIDAETNTSGYGSSQRSSHGNVGPLDADLNELPSQKHAGRTDTSIGTGIE